MTIAQQFRQEGWQEGRQEGRQEAIREIALTMLVNGLERTLILKVTGLTEDELQTIRP